jgi:hypothetical protein
VGQNQYQYPLDDTSNLVAVAQYLALKNDRMFPKEELVQDVLRSLLLRIYASPSEPHSILAEFVAPQCSVTTNYDNFMTQALKKKEKDPRQELCRWNKYIKDTPSIFDTDFSPTPAQPVVFHLHGYNPLAESLVPHGRRLHGFSRQHLR